MKTVTKIDANQTTAGSEKRLRVAAYCRVSTDSDDQLESLAEQKKHYEIYIQTHEDWDFAGLYYDEGISGTKKEKRSELMRLLADCEAGRIDFIITKSISRFARNTTDCLEMVRKLLAINVPIYFEKENINTASMESELVLAVLSSLAENESVSISGNQKWSVKQRFQSGTYKMNPSPYGYRWNGEQLEINYDEAAVVKRIFADYLSGKGITHIARELDSDKIAPARGKHWCQGSILRILKNENYTGSAVFQKTFTDESFHRRVNYGQMDKYLVANHHEGIISKADFDAVVALIDRHAVEKNVTKGSHKYQLRYCFSGKIICGECGTTFKHRTHRLGGEPYEAWCCSTHIYNKESCSMKFVRDEDLKRAFVTMMNKLVFGYKLILKPYLLALRSLSTDSSVQRIQQLRLLIEQNTGQQETITRLMANGYIDRVLFARELNAIMAQTDEYRSEIDALSNSVTGDGAKLKETERLIKLVERGRMFAEFDADLFTKLVDHIYVFS
ncbi:MAG: recombinase family protein, partial [Oscillospiraceae bacterium]